MRRTLSAASARQRREPGPDGPPQAAIQRRHSHAVVSYLVVLVLLACSYLLTRRADAQVTLTPSLTKIAGTNGSGAMLFNQDYGTATSVALNTPNFVAFDALGDLYFSDTASNCVRMIDPQGKISTVAGLITGGNLGDTCDVTSNPNPLFRQGLLKPSGIAVAPNGDLYIADTGHNCVRVLPDKSTGTAHLFVVAGRCSGPASGSQTPSPSGLVLDSAGNLYIAIQDSTDGTQQVLQHGVDNSVCVMAGATSARAPTTCASVMNNSITLNGPSGLAIDGQGSLVIADTGNQCVRRITGMTNIETIVAQCTNDSSGTADVSLTAPYGLQFDQTQALVISDGNQVLRYVIGSSALTLLAGLPSNAAGVYATTQDGKAGPLDPLSAPQGLAIDSSGNITVADSANHLLRQLFPNTVFAATPVNSPSAVQPITFEIGQNVNLSWAVGTDYSIFGNTCIGSLSPGTPPTTCEVSVIFTPTRPGVRNTPLTLTDSISHTEVVVGLQGFATGSQPQFFPGVVNTVATGLQNPVDIAVDIDSNAYILEQGTGGAAADVKELVAASGTLRTVVAAGGLGSDPVALARDGAGNLFVVDQEAGNVVRFPADGSASAVYLTGLVSPGALFVDGFDNLYVAQGGDSHNVVEYYASGGERVVAGSGSILDANGSAATNAQFVSPSGIYIDSNGVVYVADSGAHRVYVIDTSGIIHFVAGNGTTTTTVPATALGTALLGPTALAVDAAGDVLIADPPANIVYVAFSAGSQLLQWASILGNGTAASNGDGGASTAAEVNHPLSLALDNSGTTYVIDGGAASVRKITYPSPTLNFGTVAIGATSAPQTATLWSTGTGALSQTAALTINNANFLEDLVSSVSTCGASLVAGGTCDVGFYFKPIDRGTQIGVASAANNSYINPAIVNLIGNASTQTSAGFNLPPETEVYGDPFPEVVSLGLTGTAPTGTITFSTGTQTLCSFTGTMSAAATTCSAASSGLSVATYPVTFNYSGDTIYAPITATTTLAVTPQPTTTTIASSATPVVAGTSVTLTSTVNSALGVVTTGSVTFTDGSTTLGTGTLNSSGVATLSTTSLVVGNQTITATYGATLNFSSSAASLTQAITAPPGAFTIAVTPPSQYIRGAGSVTWQVAVTPSGGFAGPVALTCSGLPSDASCSFAAGTLTITAGTTGTTTMTTATTVGDASLKQPFGGMDLAGNLSCAFLLPLQMSGMLLAVFRRRKPRYRRALKWWLMAAVTFSILGLSGCNCFNTAFKTYTITVTGTSTLGGPPPQSATVLLSVGSQ
jgi:sugar lactone lactonase YvrE